MSVPEDDINGVDPGPTVLQAHTRLAQTAHKYIPSLLCVNCLIWHAETKRARTVLALAEELDIPCLPEMVRHFLFQQTRPDDPQDVSEIPIAGCPRYEGKILVFNSACSQFYAPSDISGIGGMWSEHIHACPMWWNEAPRYDCAFVNIGSEDVGI
ncbi:uncharacterized protein F5891DRAFT_967151 [Suillus fuscotomentosus]|uniref:Uncharacterized protein n=1 Tax=Suillus fuscotomentosus TaxID=1912939 RepID=A0AAD4DR47_9AGAM|nr:uncharacterized protein F5891DRAFT_967151 [Suillus fuscotomentosus]KAG1887460.1 hypothetical protein F5891DRAFT_967151 [Suillus fuscotomentosus]